MAQRALLDLPHTAPVQSSARLSDDGCYRYELDRTWGGGPVAVFVMLNPSTADASTDDPTIRRCMGYARAWGLAGIKVVNLYAFRSTDPAGLWTVDDPVGPDNDDVLRKVARDAAQREWPLVAAWGAHARPDRVRAVMGLNRQMARAHCLGVTKNGAPRHPLYLRADAPLRQWPVTPEPVAYVRWGPNLTEQPIVEVLEYEPPEPAYPTGRVLIVGSAQCPLWADRSQVVIRQ